MLVTQSTERTFLLRDLLDEQNPLASAEEAGAWVMAL